MSASLISLIREIAADTGDRSDEEIAEDLRAQLRAEMTEIQASGVQQTITIALNPGTYSSETLEQLFKQINDGLRDGGPFHQ
ncbi:hypothetical protein [Terrihabitans sp. B22-R8]|uniref:hypothetical protein n=1 Tax=Terrihabitans sp. B22-R8 TaxID=3425128 RepID=UPI00403C7D3F